MNTTGDWLPLFPLDLALLPGALLPLHVFEPRYRALARHSLAGDRRFGVVRMHAGQLARVGCVARIVQVLQAYPDGRSDILARGEERFTLRDLREHADGYLEARTDAVHDEPGPGPDSEERLLLERLFRDYAQLADDDDLPGGAWGAADADRGPGVVSGALDGGTTVDDRTVHQEGTALDEGNAPSAGTAPSEDRVSEEDGRDPAVGPDRDGDAAATKDADRFSFALAVRTPLGVDERQSLLETMTERERTLALLGHLARLIPRLRAHEKDRRKVRGNGKLVPAEE
jgi:hypothetical protein